MPIDHLLTLQPLQLPSPPQVPAPGPAQLAPLRLDALQLSSGSAPSAHVQAAQRSLQGFSGTGWAGTMASNYGQEATILIPSGFNPKQPAELIVFYHGMSGSAAESTNRLKTLIEGLPKQGRNALVVIPSWEAKADKAGHNLQSLQNETQAKAEELLGQKLSINRYTVQGYSRGGLPIAQAAQTGQLRAQHIVLFDSTYGSWGQAIVNGRQSGSTVQVFYTGHNALRAGKLKGKPGVTVEASGTSHSGTPIKHFYR